MKMRVPYIEHGKLSLKIVFDITSGELKLLT
jgi:hypothetical protein